MKLRYRNIKARDILQCSALIMKNFAKLSKVNGGFLESGAAFRLMKDSNPLKLFGAILNPKKQTRVVTDENGTILGLVVYTTKNGKTGYIEKLFVSPEFHNNGVGTTLLRNIITEMKDAGLTTVYTHAIISATRVYQNLGFTHDQLKGDLFGQGVCEDSAKDHRIPTVDGPMGPRFAYYMERKIDQNNSF